MQDTESNASHAKTSQNATSYARRPYSLAFFFYSPTVPKVSLTQELTARLKPLNDKIEALLKEKRKTRPATGAKKEDTELKDEVAGCVGCILVPLPPIVTDSLPEVILF